MAILFDCMMTFFGSTANDASLNAYITDVTTTENRGRVMGVVEILTWVAIFDCIWWCRINHSPYAE